MRSNKLLSSINFSSNLYTVFHVNDEQSYLSDTCSSNSILTVMEKCQKHPSIFAATKLIRTSHIRFSFKAITLGDVTQDMQKLNIWEANQATELPTKLAKRYKDTISCWMRENLKNCLGDGAVYPSQKQERKTCKSNCRNIIIKFKVYERSHMDNYIPILTIPSLNINVMKWL